MEIEPRWFVVDPSHWSNFIEFIWWLPKSVIVYFNVTCFTTFNLCCSWKNTPYLFIMLFECWRSVFIIWWPRTEDAVNAMHSPFTPSHKKIHPLTLMLRHNISRTLPACSGRRLSRPLRTFFNVSRYISLSWCKPQSKIAQQYEPPSERKKTTPLKTQRPLSHVACLRNGLLSHPLLFAVKLNFYTPWLVKRCPEVPWSKPTRGYHDVVTGYYHSSKVFVLQDGTRLLLHDKGSTHANVRPPLRQSKPNTHRVSLTQTDRANAALAHWDDA